MKELQKLDALLEIGSEEIPSSYLPVALEFSANFVRKFLSDQHLSFSQVRTFGSPRRIAIIVEGVAAKSDAQVQEVSGPSIKAARDAEGQWTGAALGFAKSQGVTPKDLKVRQTPKGEYVFAIKKHSGIKAEKLLAQVFTEVASQIPFPKKMVWNATQFKFARPIRNILALYGSKTLRIEVAGIKADNKTFPLSHISGKMIKISSPAQYVQTLKNNCILVEPEMRSHAIVKGANQLAKKEDGMIQTDESLLQEVAWLVEHPVAVLGSFDKEFLKIPQIVLITAMKKHQKFFALLDNKGKLLPHFVGIRNGISEHQDIVRKGYEKVLNARLNDAAFFYKEDLKKPLQDHIEKCKRITVQAKTGSMAQRLDRMQAVASSFISYIGQNAVDSNVVKRAIELSKFDLSTQMVYEYGELQGEIGSIYAQVYGESAQVASAIRQHYYPLSAQGQLPQGTEACVVALTEKMEGLVSNFWIGNKPSGSSDPYGMRRQSTGILRILLAQKWDISLVAWLENVLQEFEKHLGKCDRDLKSLILDFLRERFQLLLLEQGYSVDEVQAVLANYAQAQPTGNQLCLVTLQQKVMALNHLRKQKDFEPLAAAFKRAGNILKQARSKNISFNLNPNVDLFKHDSEKQLFAVLQQVQIKFDEHFNAQDYVKALQQVVPLRGALDQFFDSVMVMDPDALVAQNRLSLLANLENLFKQTADFAQLQS